METKNEKRIGGNRRPQTFRDCLQCGKRFGPLPRLSAQFCSKACAYKFRKGKPSKILGKKYPHLQRARIGKCLICGKEYRAVSDFKGRNQKYCSKECWSIRATKTNKCKFCGKEIKTSHVVNKQYCGNECRNLHYRETMKGENSHFWQGGKTKELTIKRTSAEYRDWRMGVFKRDGFKCVKCGSKKDIEADHIKAVSEYPELIFETSNGRTLCHQCHKETENYGYRQSIKMQALRVNQIVRLEPKVL